jgi:hypothetical protein
MFIKAAASAARCDTGAPDALGTIPVRARLPRPAQKLERRNSALYTISGAVIRLCSWTPLMRAHPVRAGDRKLATYSI